MRQLLLILAFIISSTCTRKAQAQVFPAPARIGHTPVPPYPAAALAAKITGSGTCQVFFDAAGHADKAVMTKSTGSSILDENTLSFARIHWTGKPNKSLLVPVVYQLAKPIIVHTPLPPYPFQARADHVQGSGSISVTFDKSGKAISAKMTKSTGSSILDDNSVNYALAHWKTSGGEKTTLSVPVAYRLQ